MVAWVLEQYTVLLGDLQAFLSPGVRCNCIRYTSQWKKKEVGWSHRRKRVIRAHTNGVFSPRNPDSRFITLPRRAGGAVALVFLFYLFIIIYFSVVIGDDNVFINCLVHLICVQITQIACSKYAKAQVCVQVIILSIKVFGKATACKY